MMPNFQRLKSDLDRFAEKMRETYDLNREISLKLIIYSKSLCNPKTDDIDECTFTAEMAKVFDITERLMVARMYQISKTNEKMNSDEFCLLLGLFLSNNVLKQSEYVFRIYDVDCDGELNLMELTLLVQPHVLAKHEEEDFEDNHKELIDIVIKFIDINDNGQVEKAEFIERSKSDPLILDFLGKCLPSRKTLLDFQRFLDSYSNTELRNKVLCHRTELLKAPEMRKIDPTGYPVMLEYF